MRYRSWKSDVRHENNAVIIYMMDVSGSMGDEQKEIVRTEAFWIDTWLRSQYKGIETRYIIHDATAREVDEETFFKTRESGGTLISSAYKLCRRSSRRIIRPRSGTSIRFISPTAITGRARTLAFAWRFSSKSSASDLQCVLLRPGRVALRLGPVL